ncbi:MAG: hypothetical protein HND53_08065 [Proteobacteria bacterium]|nr:hypothetical protein [Pseudomonadota bacterium]NOG60437.1 hypothetical protein [Pseudomonadota bacterium]
MRIILILAFSLTTVVVEARMYQWVEPGVETTQLSGKPPAWYRSATGGPRVFVFDNGRLIDDTAVEVDEEIRQRMRQEAFVLGEEDRQKAKEKMAKAQEMKQQFKKKSADTDEELDNENINQRESVVELITDALFPDDKTEENKDEEATGKDMDELRAIIADWEAAQTESAKQALE